MGPLDGVRVVEMAGIGPGPFTAMLLADMGADVVRVVRTAADRSTTPAPPRGPLERGRPEVALPLKTQAGRDTTLRLVEEADALIEGFRPGVMERLGLGPDVCLARNPRLVYGRMTGWGQTGPLSASAGHDINYIALAGVLRHIARRGEAPVPPLNLVGDFGGGGLLLAFGLVCALLEARGSGRGQVVDAAMVDGSALLMTMTHALRAGGWWNPEPGTNLLDTGAPFYDVYETADGRYIALGAQENKFFAELVARLGIDVDPARQQDRASWPALREQIATAVRRRTRDEWEKVFGDSDACVTPVLDMDEAPRHPHLAERGTFVEIDGVVQPAPAPRFSRTPGSVRTGFGSEHPLRRWGFTGEEIDALDGA